MRVKLARSQVDGGLAFLLAELAALPRAAVVVEDRFSRQYKLEHVQPGFVADLLAAVQVRYPSVPIVFGETRPLAEEWTFRFLGRRSPTPAPIRLPSRHQQPAAGENLRSCSREQDLTDILPARALTFSLRSTLEL
jgi:hypothetical protein